MKIFYKGSKLGSSIINYIDFLLDGIEDTEASNFYSTTNRLVLGNIKTRHEIQYYYGSSHLRIYPRIINDTQQMFPDISDYNVKKGIKIWFESKFKYPVSTVD